MVFLPDAPYVPVGQTGGLDELDSLYPSLTDLQIVLLVLLEVPPVIHTHVTIAPSPQVQPERECVPPLFDVIPLSTFSVSGSPQ